MRATRRRSQSPNVLGTSIAYVEAGRGDPIVSARQSDILYPGRNVIPEVVGRGRCIAPDLIGMGDSEKIAEGPGPQIGAAISEFLQNL